MGKILDVISIPLGYLMNFLYDLTGNYGLVLILLTIIVRVCLIPLGVKQQKSMIETQKIQPKLQAIQQKYKNDKEKLNEEMTKLYQENNIKPTAGCLPLLIQMPILFALIQVIYHPIQYMHGLFPEGLAKIQEMYGSQIANVKSNYMEILLANKTCRMNFNFLGIDLSLIPSEHKTEILVWVLPVLATVATYFSGKISQKMTQSASQSDNPAAGSMKMMNWMMPLMTIFFTYSMPSGAALYWFISTAVSLVQTVVLNKIFRRGEPLPASGVIEEKPKKEEKVKNPNPYKSGKKKPKTKGNKEHKDV